MLPNCFGDVFDDRHPMFKVGKFFVDEEVYTKTKFSNSPIGKLKVLSINTTHDVPMYECIDQQEGRIYTLLEFELESIYQHDKRIGLLNK